MIVKKTFPAKTESVSEIVSFVGETLVKLKQNKKTVLKEQLRIEEISAKIIQHCNSESDLTLTLHSFLKHYEIRINCNGEEFPIAELSEEYENLLGDDDDMNSFIRRFAANVIGENIKLKHKNGANNCTILKQKNKRSQLFLTLAGLVLGVIAGFALKALAPEAVSGYLSSNIFGSVSTVFLSAMKMIVAPLVFFSISASIADFGDLKTLGKVALKVFCCYLFTSLIAIFVGLLTYNLVPIGDTSLASLVTDAAGDAVAKSDAMSLSIKDTIIGIVPSDFITPFLKSDMLQVIFVASLMGIAVSSLGKEHKIFKDIIVSGNAVFSKITAIIVSFMPVAVFCSMAIMVIEIDLKSLASVVMWLPVCYLGDIIMMVVYGILILVMARLNPFKFYKGYFPASLTAYSLGSSNASIPMSVKMCEEKLGISKKLYSFSIPFGATVNMDGNCITLMITSMFMAKIFGIAVTPSIIFTLSVAIMLLSIGAPGVPGGCLVCIAFLLPQIGIPAEAISIIMGLYSLVGMGLCCCNSTGDAVVTTIVAKSENMIDLDKYNAN